MKIRFILFFALLLLAGFGLLMAPFTQSSVLAFSRTLVWCSAPLIHAAGGSVKAEGAVMIAPASGFGVEMKNGCNAVEVLILLWAAILAFPSPLSLKVKGCLIGAAAIQVINFVRFISPFYIGQYSAALFDFAHRFLWESLIMLDAMIVFWLWVQAVFRAQIRSHG
jgi:exosortase H (IPTLxxWG-CTERM-specific)